MQSLLSQDKSDGAAGYDDRDVDHHGAQRLCCINFPVVASVDYCEPRSKP